ncbi:hypothetical protein [Achromobacter sp. UMC71]|uniref:hypothetical protein n=1 Tax=Achromobacter sp. UMC71 TaxID=1862320 RepID=UPI00160305FA|nr:hypothetical protein [Achromobacter sp. UMC71]MBB1627149.1 hypothetical protein [Achromobacter sp. UMC71]
MRARRALILILSLLGASAAADTVYNRDGLVVEVSAGSRQDWNTGQRQHTRATAITFQGKTLCGNDVTDLLYPDGNGPPRRAFYCPNGAMALDGAGVLAFFTSGSADTVLAHLQVVNGSLRAQRVDVSKDPGRNKVQVTRFLDARLPGWTRVETAWNETVLIRHAPLQANNLGPGRLLDIDGDVAYLAVPAGSKVIEIEPTKRVKDAYGYMQIVPAVTKFVPTPTAFRVVRLADGRELARWEAKDTCQQLPAMQFDPGSSSVSSKIDVPYEDLPAWRAKALRFTPGPPGKATLRMTPGVELPHKPHCTPA